MITSPELGTDPGSARLLAAFPHVRLVRANDDAALAAFHRSVPMDLGPLSLAYEFPEGPLKAAVECGAPTVVTAFHEEGVIRGTASLACRRGVLDGRVIPYGYLANLRIGPGMSRRLRREWRTFFGALVSSAASLQELGRPRFLLTSVLDGNERAVRFLTQRLKEVRYHALQRYESVLAFRPLPGARRHLRGVRFRCADLSDTPRLRRFLVATSAQRPFSDELHSDGEDELTRRLATWDGFGLDQFVLAEDEKTGQILATVAARLCTTRSLSLIRAPWAVTAGLRFARPFGVPPLVVPGPLKLLYLSSLETAPELAPQRRSELVHALLFEVWRTHQRRLGALAMAFAMWPGFSMPVDKLRGWAHLRTRGTLYQVTAPGEPPHASLARAAHTAPLPFDLSIA